ncbi:hypothetical protein K437DRAFT_246309 [Tilletiaria anomala UBC 951]|uniref:Uncharacterized protein n=1 Tax=Tilletiaria anomala (strain ATCC 24038 / CBS 436.72 / UBC 951) TaxID=1037660 RepID=A0A066VZ88_TILAU|nr:uncharacterized protein K437DRAFT_246309 [Tilletiaria anomala UBC 951]KDN46791.1 hypothetical protein K437DRAFT_246309 [Tilletiaria anomala UBC 951]
MPAVRCLRASLAALVVVAYIASLALASLSRRSDRAFLRPSRRHPLLGGTRERNDASAAFLPLPLPAALSQKKHKSKDLTTVGDRPAGAYARNFHVTSPHSLRGGDVFTWYSKTPHAEADAEAALIVVHGKRRNAGHYWSVFNKIWSDHVGIGSARSNTVRVAPLFFSIHDAQAYNDSSLAWGNSNGWQTGDASSHPLGATISSFTVLDYFVELFSDRKKFPKMKYITLAGHGAGGQLLARYAVVGHTQPADKAGISLRMVISDPSSHVYFTQDRPVPFDRESCKGWNSWRYALRDYSLSRTYPLPEGGSPVKLFKRYAKRDVRYVVGEDDVKPNGDQSCMAQALGGPERTKRNQAYWKYINLLGDSRANAEVAHFFGDFPALDKDTAQRSAHSRNISASTERAASPFKGTKVAHKFALVSGAGHQVKEVYGSELGSNFLFEDRDKLDNSPAP